MQAPKIGTGLCRSTSLQASSIPPADADDHGRSLYLSAVREQTSIASNGRMENTGHSGQPRRGKIALGIVLGALGVGSVVLTLLHGSAVVNGQTAPTAHNFSSNVPSRGVFTPAHPTIGLAVRHFFGWRAEAVQPIAFNHSAHIGKAQMECLDCHLNAAIGPRATIPDVTWCMTCHKTIATDKPAVQQVAAYFNRGEDIPWQRVYGWNDEAHVRFNHVAHTVASVPCTRCHGDVGGMTDAKRVVDHTMGFCISCHQERKASIDCLTCHF
jgi:hypothetical protein